MLCCQLIKLYSTKPKTIGNKAIVDITLRTRCAPPITSFPTDTLHRLRSEFSKFYLHLSGILNDPFCCMTLSMIELSLLHRTWLRWLQKRLPMLLNGPGNPQNCPFIWGSAPLSNTWFLGLTRVLIQNSMSISSAIFAQLTAGCPNTLQCATIFPPKIAPSPYDFVTLPEKDQATAIGNMHKKLGEDRACGSGDILTDKQTDAQTQTDVLTTMYRHCSHGRSKK